MSTPELPPPAGFVINLGRGEGWDVIDKSNLEVGVDVYTADQMREMYRAGRLAGLEEAARVAAGLNGWGSQPAPELARHIVTSIRALKEKQA